MEAPKFYALLYLTVTGEIMDGVGIPLSAVPQWLQQINMDGSWGIQTQISTQAGDGGLTKDQLWDYTDAWRFSVAICFGTGSRPGDYICQAGPLVSDQLMSEQPAILQLGGTGLWGLLRMTMQILAGTTTPASGDMNFTNSLQGIAAALLTNANARNPMPIDIPAGPFSGTTNINYFGYDLASVGQRLQELTQLQNGPDILLKPYFSDSTHIRHTALFGNPYLFTGANSPVFQYPGDCISILPTRNGSNLSTITYEKGNGTEYATPFATAVDTTLTGAGWPVLEKASLNHSDVVDIAILQKWANTDQALNGRTQSVWMVTAAAQSSDAPLGSFDPGVFAQYNVQNHCRLRDGIYSNRVIGLQNAPKIDQYMHILHASTAPGS